MQIKYKKYGSTTVFHKLEGINREVSSGHVLELERSVGLMGIIRPVVVTKVDFIDIDKTSKYYILDGQHLNDCLERLRKDVPYVLVQCKDKKDLVKKIAKLNSSSKKWILMDYLKAWGGLSKDYRELKDYISKYNIEVCTLAYALSDNASTNGSTKALKNGDFKLSVKLSEKLSVLDQLTECLKSLPSMNKFENKYFCKEYLVFRDKIGTDYSHKNFLEYLSSHKDTVILSTNERGKLSEMFYRLICTDC